MTILVVEDQTMVRELLVLACSQAYPDARVESVGTTAAARTGFRRFKPDVVLLDLVLPDGDGLGLLPDVFAAVPQARVIALSSHIDEFTLHQAMASRVHGILDKNEQPVRILRDAIEAVTAGKIYISSSVERLRASVRADPGAFDKVLSDREQEVLRLIGDGLANDAIAARLRISASTAKHHRLNIMAKLQLHSTPQLIRYALEKGFTHVSRQPQPPAS